MCVCVCVCGGESNHSARNSRNCHLTRSKTCNIQITPRAVYNITSKADHSTFPMLSIAYRVSLSHQLIISSYNVISACLQLSELITFDKR